jgi:hypothetical protein
MRFLQTNTKKHTHRQTVQGETLNARQNWALTCKTLFWEWFGLEFYTQRETNILSYLTLLMKIFVIEKLGVPLYMKLNIDSDKISFI